MIADNISTFIFRNENVKEIRIVDKKLTDEYDKAIELQKKCKENHINTHLLSHLESLAEHSDMEI